MKIFTMPEGEEHEKGNSLCSECWKGFPKKCKCGSLIHASFGDETDDGYWLYQRCENCESNYEINGED